MTRRMRQKRLVIISATGMVGGYALRYWIDHMTVGTITTGGRKQTGITRPKRSTHSGKFVHTKAGKSFNKRFTGNKDWHFVDYPLDGDYSRDTQFSSPRDVVHMTNNCVLVL